MSHQSMLANLVPRLTKQTENVATDALLYLLKKYPCAEKAFIAYVSEPEVGLPENLHFDSQIGLATPARPDLVGKTANGDYVLMVESKFWATLTPNQPLTYLEYLPRDEVGIVLFVAPASRFPTLWDELVGRCIEGGMSIDLQIDQAPDYLCAAVESDKYLGLASWESLLQHLKEALESDGVIDGAHEVWQLQGLCERLDAEAFHPLQADDLKSTSDRQVDGFIGIVDDVTGLLVEQGYADIKGYSATPGAGYYRRYMTLFGVKDWCVAYSSSLWKRYQRSPIWLTTTQESVRRFVANLDLAGQEALGEHYDYGGKLNIPLVIPTGVERQEILHKMVEQILGIQPLIAAEEE